MSDSDVDSDYDDGLDDGPHRPKRDYEKYIGAPRGIVDVFERYRQISSSLKKKTCQVMHMCVFWWNILLRQHEKNTTTHWALQVGLLDNHVTGDLTLKRLYRIEILESILRALEKGCLSDELTKHLVFLSNQFDMQADCMDEAVRWLEKTGEPDIATQIQRLGSRRIRFLTLSYVFTEHAHYVRALACNKEETTTQYNLANCKCCVQRSEEMKNKGNELFQKRKYDAAVRWYTKAIKYHPDNHILYGNRALCFIRCEKYQKAIGDGKRATIIRPEWAKGHYRFCDALFSLGEHKRALEANERAQGLCFSDAEGFRELLQQRDRFLEIQDSRGVGKLKKNGGKKDPNKRPDSVPRAGAESLHSTDPASSTVHTSDNPATEQESEDVSACGDYPVTVEGVTQAEGNSKEPKEVKSEIPAKKTFKTEPYTPEKPKTRIRHPPPQEKMGASTDVGDLRGPLKSAVQDAHTALSDQRCRNAEQAFAEALYLLNTAAPKELGISELDAVILKYGHASALLETGQPEELAEAKEEFLKIQEIAESDFRNFQCLIFYGIGKVCLRENRFSAALEQFYKAVHMVKLQITPGKLTWPTTKVLVEETQTEYLKDLLEKFIEMCKFPPKPDAVCRHQTCQGHSKMEIYFTDPDFKGFIRTVCCQSCNVEFHISCWKKMKATIFSDKNDKDFLQETCFTPDCGGKICHIVIFGSTGFIKCEFESSIQKTTVSAKTRVKQKCTSLKKLKSKEDQKMRRKEHRLAVSQATQEKAQSVPVEKSDRSGVEHQEKASQAWLFYGDRVLHQICEKKELLKEGTYDIPAFMKCLQPWREWEKGQENSINSLKEPETLGDVVDLLLDSKNRVWARIFIQHLSTLNINPKLHDWAHKLDSAGLGAAETFIDRYAEHLEELDLAPLLAFAPMQDVLIEKFGTVPEIFSEGFTVTDYLKQAPPQDVRIFIWTLEENRQLYPSFHHALNEYFEIMDGLCLVIKKTEHENQVNSPIKSKNRSRKKKQKEPKSLIVLSGMRGGALREEEDDDIFNEEDSLTLFDTTDPFIVPNHLRDQVAEFEGQYVNIVPGSLYRRILDNNPDSTKESLYDYFEQILEEHGPMETHSQLLVGELQHFPAEAQLKIQEAGGLQAFLLESLRFVMMDNLIGLMKHAVSLRDVTDDPMAALDYLFPPDLEDPSTLRNPYLNPSAKEFQPLSQNPVPGDGDASVSFGRAAPQDMKELSDSAQTLPQSDDFDFSLTDIVDYFSYPNPFVFEPSNPPLHVPFATGSSEVYDWERKSDSPVPYLDTFDNPSKDRKSHNNETDSAVEVKVTKRLNNGAQAFPERRDDVAVNTEPYEPFETNKGDMIKKDKDNVEFEKQIHQMMEGYKEQQQRRKEDISTLEAELESIRLNTEISNKELELFQQKLEEEVKKDQQEKKENQETVKALKAEIKELSESHETFSKNIREKNKEYEKHLNDFLERSNQSATEKMSMEDEIKRCRGVCADAARRSQAAEISILENRRGRGLRGLIKCASDGEVILAKIKDMAERFPSSGFQPAAEAWQDCVRDAREKILKIETQYKGQMELLKKGTRLCTLPLVSVPSAPTPPPLPARPLVPVINDPSVVQVVYPVRPARQLDPRQYFTPYGAQQQLGLRAPSVAPPVRAVGPLGKGGQQPDRVAQASPPAPAVKAHALAAGNAHNGAAVRPAIPPLSQGPRAGPQKHNTFEKIIDRLSNMFPHYSRPSLTTLIQEVRSINGGCLNNLSCEEVINGVAQLILDHQDNTREQISSTHRADPGASGPQLCWTPPPRSDSPAAGRTSSTPPPSHAWKSVGAQNTKWAKSKAIRLNVEDPCIICHEEMTPDELCVLECRHSFHRECIKSWLKEQSTCPTCREHALLPEDFPLLPGRIRRGHTPAAPSS